MKIYVLERSKNKMASIFDTILYELRFRMVAAKATAEAVIRPFQYTT